MPLGGQGLPVLYLVLCYYYGNILATMTETSLFTGIGARILLTAATRWIPLGLDALHLGFISLALVRPIIPFRRHALQLRRSRCELFGFSVINGIRVLCIKTHSLA